MGVVLIEDLSVTDCSREGVLGLNEAPIKEVWELGFCILSRRKEFPMIPADCHRFILILYSIIYEQAGAGLHQYCNTVYEC